MMKRLFSTICFAVALCASANAVVVQKIHLKNGSVLNGYIKQQDGNGNIVVSTENAVICLKKANVNSPTDVNVPIGTLSSKWKEWAEENDAYNGTGNNRTLTLSVVTMSSGRIEAIADSVMEDPAEKKVVALTFEARLRNQGKTFDRVRVLEKGSVVKFLELTPNTYTLSWSDVETVKADRRPKNALSGIDRKYTLKSGREISGQYAGETATTMSLYQNNGMVETVDFDDVVKYSFNAINPNQDIFAQAELLDVVRTKHYGNVKGVIIEQNYSSKKETENFISVWEQGKSPQMFKVSEIVSINREENPSYDPKYDVILNDNEVVVNRLPTEYVKVSENSDLLVLDSLSHKVIVNKEVNAPLKLVVEYNNQMGANIEMFQLVKLVFTPAKKKQKASYCFSYKDLVNSVIRANSIETSVNNTTKAEYTVPSVGDYALYDAKNKRAICVIVK